MFSLQQVREDLSGVIVGDADPRGRMSTDQSAYCTVDKHRTGVDARSDVEFPFLQTA